MAFRITSDRPVRAIRRVVRKQLRSSIELLDDGKQPLGERVHKMRTSIKKVRALAALIRPTSGRRARRADRCLRKATASTSELRDDAVLLQTFDALLPSLASEVESKSLRRARRRLAAGLRQVARSFYAERRVDELVARLERARHETRRWMPRKGGWGTLRRGLDRGYRRARRAMRRAYDQETSVAFHRWRKAVKAHRFQLQLLQEVWLGESTARLDALDHLGKLLGEEHDLTVLEQTVGTDRACFPEERDRARLLALVDRRRQQLRSEARQLAGPVFAERPRAFRRRLREQSRGGPGRPAQAIDHQGSKPAGGTPGWRTLRAV